MLHCVFSQLVNCVCLLFGEEHIVHRYATRAVRVNNINKDVR